MTLVPDFERQLLRGEETIEFQAEAGAVEWEKQAGLRVVSADVADGEVTVAEQAVRVRLRSGGRHRLKLKYTAAAGRGIKWFADNAGLATAFYCEAWMVCDNSPGQRSTLQLEIAVPFGPLTQGTSGFQAVGPGRRGKEWRGRDGDHFVFEQSEPVQTYLFSFGVARLDVEVDGMLSIYAQKMDANKAAFAKTADAYAFLRAAASVDPRLNEGFAEFMSDAYIERHQGRAAYDKQIAELQGRLKKLREEGKDRPLHWEKWKDAHEALGPIPYVKGALFLARLRTELGDEIFWRGIGLYTSGNAHRLVDSGDFERAMEKASGRDLKALFDEAVYR